MSYDFRYTGIIKGCDARSPKGFQHRTSLRETTRWWVTPNGHKFLKSDGTSVPAEDWPMYWLDLTTVNLTYPPLAQDK